MKTPRWSWSPAERRRRIALGDLDVYLIDEELAELSGGRHSFPPGADAPDSREKTDLLARRRAAVDELITLHSPRYPTAALTCISALAAVLIIVTLMLIF